MRTWDRKSIYHSTLVGYNREHDEGLPCKVVAGPMSSKDGSGKIVRIRVLGEPEDDQHGYWLKLENEDVVQSFEEADLADERWLILEAAGSREAATVRFKELPKDFEDMVEAGVVETVKPAAKTNGTATTSHKAAEQVSINYDDDEFLNSLLQAHNIVEKYEEITGKPLDDHVRTLATNLRNSKGGGWQRD